MILLAFLAFWQAQPTPPRNFTGATFSAPYAPPVWQQESLPIIYNHWDLLTGEQYKYDFVEVAIPYSVAISFPSNPTIILTNSDGHSITINLKDGSVKFEGVNPDAAALLFWATVTDAFPYVRQMMISNAQHQ